jgi:hypothetical protein
MNERRLWSLDIGGEPFINESDLNQFRITFDVDIRPGDSVSFADIRIYNLKKDTGLASGQAVILRAGYTNKSDIIFTGVITNVFREREGASIATRLLCRSGSAVIDKPLADSSYNPGVAVIDVLKDIASTWSRRLMVDESQFEGEKMVSGYVLLNDVTVELNRLARAYNFDWNDHNGQLFVTRRGAPRKTAVNEISQFTGMIGIPERTRGPEGLGVYVVNRLNPYFRINQRIYVKSEFNTFNSGNLMVTPIAGDASTTGEYNIIALRFRGDSFGNQWLVEIDGLRANSAPSNSTNGKLVWGARSPTQDFRAKVREVSEQLNIDPSWLMAVMYVETGGEFRSNTRNPNSTATGLIQFLESTARSLGTTTTKLARMTEVQQMDYVYAYLKPYKGRMNSMGDVYMAVFAPVAVGKPDSYVLYSSPTPAYNANASLDRERKGYITKGDAVARVNAAYLRGQNYAA